MNTELIIMTEESLFFPTFGTVGRTVVSAKEGETGYRTGSWIFISVSQRVEEDRIELGIIMIIIVIILIMILECIFYLTVLLLLGKIYQWYCFVLYLTLSIRVGQWDNTWQQLGLHLGLHVTCIRADVGQRLIFRVLWWRNCKALSRTETRIFC